MGEELGCSPVLYLEENLKVHCNHERTRIKAAGPASDLIPNEAGGGWNPGLTPSCSPAPLCSWGADEKSEGPCPLCQEWFPAPENMIKEWICDLRNFFNSSCAEFRALGTFSRYSWACA